MKVTHRIVIVSVVFTYLLVALALHQVFASATWGALTMLAVCALFVLCAARHMGSTQEAMHLASEGRD